MDLEINSIFFTDVEDVYGGKHDFFLRWLALRNITSYTGYVLWSRGGFSFPDLILICLDVWIILGGPGNVFDTTYMDEMNGCRFPTPVFFFFKLSWE